MTHDEIPAHEARARAHEADNRRRGEPLPGCDCLRCFGRCSIDRDVQVRELLSRDAQGHAVAAGRTLGAYVEFPVDDGRDL